MTNKNILYGKNAIHNAININPEIIEIIFILKKSKTTDKITYLIKLKKISMIYVKKHINNIPSEIQIVCKLKNNTNKKTTLLSIIKKTKTPLFLILDRIQDPHNLGACIRSAEAANVTAIILTKNRSAKLSPLVLKISCSNLNKIQIITINNLVKTINILKANNILIIGMSANNNNSIYKKDLKIPIAIIIGSETNGIKQLVLKSCDDICKIPTYGTNKSLNVSVATGITLFEAQRQRNINL
ncbi:MAG TPA: 23S rRNA (guanosine(2251)-2'-O)-methyltransferase RlmB [Candidatus Azoamicus sp. OHIO1]